MCEIIDGLIEDERESGWVSGYAEGSIPETTNPVCPSCGTPSEDNFEPITLDCKWCGIPFKICGFK